MHLRQSIVISFVVGNPLGGEEISFWWIGDGGSDGFFKEADRVDNSGIFCGCEMYLGVSIVAGAGATGNVSL